MEPLAFTNITKRQCYHAHNAFKNIHYFTAHKQSQSFIPLLNSVITSSLFDATATIN